MYFSLVLRKSSPELIKISRTLSKKKKEYDLILLAKVRRILIGLVEPKTQTIIIKKEFMRISRKECIII